MAEDKKRCGFAMTRPYHWRTPDSDLCVKEGCEFWSARLFGLREPYTEIAGCAFRLMAEKE